MSTLDFVVTAALNKVAEADRLAHAKAFDEIRQHGTYWAAGEIARLRLELERAQQRGLRAAGFTVPS